MSLRIATVSLVAGLLLLSALVEAKKSHSKSGSHSHSDKGPEDWDDEMAMDDDEMVVDVDVEPRQKKGSKSSTSHSSSSSASDSSSDSEFSSDSNSHSESDSSTSKWKKAWKHHKGRKGSHSGSHSHSDSDSPSKLGLEDADDYNGAQDGPDGKVRGGHKPRGWFERWNAHKGRHHKGCMFHRHKFLAFHVLGGAVILALIAAVLAYRRRARRLAAIAYVAAPTTEVAETALETTEGVTVAVEVIPLEEVEATLPKESAPVPTA